MISKKTQARFGSPTAPGDIWWHWMEILLGSSAWGLLCWALAGLFDG